MPEDRLDVWPASSSSPPKIEANGFTISVKTHGADRSLGATASDNHLDLEVWARRCGGRPVGWSGWGEAGITRIRMFGRRLCGSPGFENPESEFEVKGNMERVGSWWVQEKQRKSRQMALPLISDFLAAMCMKFKTLVSKK
jgi:hypothetical protein